MDYGVAQHQMSYTNYPEVATSHGKEAVTVEPILESDFVTANVESRRATRRTICGVSTRVFTVVATLLALLIAAVIGGGVGGALSVNSCHNELDTCRTTLSARNETNSTSSASTNSSCPTANPVPQTNCGWPSASSPPANFTPTYTSIVSSPRSTFNKSCNTNVAGSDIVLIVVSSWDLCMEACATYNANRNTSDSRSCTGVSFVPSWIDQASSESAIGIWANCGLKYRMPQWGDPAAVNQNRGEIVASWLRTS